ncbi:MULTISPECIES: hypothetical protein [Bacillaceae]|uniref:Uncharacterized protein n=2 Tax=Bacillus infantis TaxID=324767 RepID=U5L8M5_9BACI|nr:MULTISPECIES: hypothetical protein [Bacillus]OXT14775.1 hypothetical protein B9K06_24395 [Bacillus sp. OG2]AGX03723.1 hypothetical protein N288_09010 [Bacillus infantis NRRL B-14911]EAR64847.1 hypothetical protein B14911_11302 [Bacillus sp. NRRL B-14911]MCA1034560.1 hypothetical protein [Bacillus infantis]MCK6203993.1 hypothetical protein [Bacillus infantis]
MVTAIVIPIICLYFFWVTRKERRNSEAEWRSIGMVPEEAVIEGKVTALHLEKQRYYHHLYVWVLEMRLQASAKTIIARKLQAADQEFRYPGFKEGEFIILFGKWQKDIFIVNRSMPKKGLNQTASLETD